MIFFVNWVIRVKLLQIIGLVTLYLCSYSLVGSTVVRSVNAQIQAGRTVLPLSELH